MQASYLLIVGGGHALRMLSSAKVISRAQITVMYMLHCDVRTHYMYVMMTGSSSGAMNPPTLVP